MKKWLMPLVAVAVAIAGSAFALTACGNDGDGQRQYEVTLSFNTSVTQEDIEEAEAILRAFDDELDFVIMESFPPIGRALLETDASDFCTTVEEKLEAKSYVDGVSCHPWKESGDAGQDVPVSVDGTGPLQALSVSELLANPVYDREVHVWGEVSLLGELFCPCFELTSEGETVIVWHDLMVEDDGTERPSISTEGIENGDIVVVSGELKRGSTHAAPSELWAESIEKWARATTSTIMPSRTPGLPPETLWGPRTSSESEWMSTDGVRASLTCRV